jgi:hypothetical protein
VNSLWLARFWRLFLLASVVLTGLALAQTPERASYEVDFWPVRNWVIAKPTMRMQIQEKAAPIVVDGRLDDWSVAPLRSDKSPRSFRFQYGDAGLQFAMTLSATDIVSAANLRFRFSLIPRMEMTKIGWPGVHLASVETCKLFAKHKRLDNGLSMQHGREWLESCEKFYRLNQQHQRWLESEVVSEFVFDGRKLQRKAPDYQFMLKHPFSEFGTPPMPVLPSSTEPQFAKREVDGLALLEGLMPWDSLGLSNALKVQLVFVQIERCNGKNKCESLLPTRAEQDYLPLELRLQNPRQYRVSECALPLIGMYQNHFYPGYFRANQDRLIHDVYAIADPFGGYFRGPDEHRRVPAITRYRYSESTLAAPDGANASTRAYVCGPLTAYREGAKLSFAMQELNQPMKLPMSLTWLSSDPKPLVVKSVNSNLSLVLEPADFVGSSTGEGQGGAEAVETMKVWLLDRKAAKFTLLYRFAFSESCWPPNVNEGAAISEDLRTLDIRKEPCDYRRGETETAREARVEKFKLCFNTAQRKYIDCER